MNNSIKGKKVLVTGADGFIGSHLVELLLNDGAEVRAYVYYNSWNEIGWLRELSSQMLKDVEIFTGDIRDPGRVREAHLGIEYVFHLSSLISIPYSYYAPRAYVDTNIVGALNVLEACRRSSSLKRLVHVSTSEVYGSAQHVPIDESHPLVGQSPYSATKIGADKLTESFYLSFGLPVVIGRPFNTFGPRQTARAVIPTIASQLASGHEVLRLGALNPTRDFNYVTDTASGMLALALCPEVEGMIVNIGTGQELSIGKVAEMLIELSGRKVNIELDESRIRPEKSEVDRLVADNRLIKRITNWEPKVSFAEGLQKTYHWVKRNLHYFNPDRYSM